MPDTVMMNTEAPVFRNRSTSIAALAAALAAAQKAFAPIPKDREVTVTSDRGNYKFKYATLDAIRNATMPALAEQSLAISQSLTTWGDHYAIETALYHASGEWMSNVTPMFLAARRTREGKELPPGNQELGSAQTYARRYGLSALLCITADEDDDGNHADGNHAEGSDRIPFKPGPAGSASGGGHFRPDGPRRFQGTPQTHQNGVRQASAAGARMAADEPELVARAAGHVKGQPDESASNRIDTPAAAASAVKRIEWVKKSVAFLKEPTTDEHVARDWWLENKARIDVVEASLPTEYERLLDAYNAALERKVEPV